MRRLLPIALPLALLAAGCGSSSSGNSSSSSSPSTASSSTSSSAPASGGAPASGRATHIVMKNIMFVPASQTVKVGEKVTWTNMDDAAPHNVTAASGASFKSTTFNKGGTFSFTPTQKGTITYMCTIHPGMNGTLIVK